MRVFSFDSFHHNLNVALSRSVKGWAIKSLVAKAVLALALSASFTCQNTSVNFRDPPENRASVGEMVYAIAKQNARASLACSSELDLFLNEKRNDLISSVDSILPPETIYMLPQLFSQSLLPGADEGTLDSIAASLAASLNLLVDDSFAPDRRALLAIVENYNGIAILQDQHGIELIRAILADPGVSEGIHAISGLSDLPMREQSQQSILFGLLQVANQLLLPSLDNSICERLDTTNSTQRLLSEQGYEESLLPGQAAWVARLNSFGTPKVLINPATQTLYLPFVDTNLDGQADHNPNGVPIDSSGDAIDIAPFGSGVGYDENRRRLAPDGTALFDYYNTKQTSLGHVLGIAGEALAAGLLAHSSALLDTAMGETSPCAGSPECFHYSGDNNPVYRLLFTLLEIAKYDKPILFLETWTTLLRENPDIAEDALVALGQVIRAIGDSTLDGSSPALYELLGETLPIVGQIFRIQTNSNKPMPRLLMSLILELGNDAREFPEQLLSSIQYKTLIKEDECSAQLPDPNSPAVDYSRPRYYVDNGTTTVDNRSSLEKSLEILTSADCGSVPFSGGKTVAHTIVDLMSRLNPDTVCNLIDNLLGLLGVSGAVGDAVVNSALFVVGCNAPDDIVASELFALDDLAKSGALNFYLPVAKSFRQEGELQSLVTLFATLGADLRKDEDDSANTASAVRPILPVLSDILRSGAVDSFFDLNEILVTVPASDGESSLADVLIDSGARLLDDTGIIETSDGPMAGVSLAGELIDALRISAIRIQSENQEESLAKTANFVSSFLTRTEMRDGKMRLLYTNLVPLLANSFEALLEIASLPSVQYQCIVNEWQDHSRLWVESPTLESLLRVGVTLTTYEGRAQIDLFLSRLLDPKPPAIAIGPTSFDEISRMVAEVLQSPESLSGTDELLRYASALADPDREAESLLLSVDQLLHRDTQRTLVKLLTDALAPRGTPKRDSPLFRLFDIADNYAGILSSEQCNAEVEAPLTLSALENSILSLVSFLSDDDSTLVFVFDLLRKRSYAN